MDKSNERKPLAVITIYGEAPKPSSSSTPKSTSRSTLRFISSPAREQPSGVTGTTYEILLAGRRYGKLDAMAARISAQILQGLRLSPNEVSSEPSVESSAAPSSGATLTETPCQVCGALLVVGSGLSNLCPQCGSRVYAPSSTSAGRSSSASSPTREYDRGNSVCSVGKTFESGPSTSPTTSAKPGAPERSPSWTLSEQTLVSGDLARAREKDSSSPTSTDESGAMPLTTSGTDAPLCQLRSALGGRLLERTISGIPLCRCSSPVECRSLKSPAKPAILPRSVFARMRTCLRNLIPFTRSTGRH